MENNSTGHFVFEVRSWQKVNQGGKLYIGVNGQWAAGFIPKRNQITGNCTLGLIVNEPADFISKGNYLKEKPHIEVNG